MRHTLINIAFFFLFLPILYVQRRFSLPSLSCRLQVRFRPPSSEGSLNWTKETVLGLCLHNRNKHIGNTLRLIEEWDRKIAGRKNRLAWNFTDSRQSRLKIIYSSALGKHNYDLNKRRY